ncbi:DUF3373 family protein [Sulfurimonas marina]|uniref:DUF3373 domain-containing protein n=1 Tax=Sulfurimonas marina TaxID=2590551 RepID=A0A7M1ATA5_9BACT|nr:DUF3373 family protein [Sulfurimonas marina]QOP40641.1 DUF3373 domain-containing protein [Sulfurimonas marina]
MKRLIPLITLPIFLVGSEDLSLKVKNLEAQLLQLKEEMRTHQEDLDERFPIIEQNERHAILDKLNISPELLVRMDKMDYTSGLIGDGDATLIDPTDPTSSYRRDRYSKDFEPAGYIRMRLNVNGDFGDVKFYSRLLYANSSQSHERLCILSRDIKSAPGGSAFDLDRAYIDYTPNRYNGGTLTFSFGILPTTGGTPSHFSQNKQRSSMFPALVFDMNTYGAILTKKFYDSLYVRAIVAKAYTLRENFYPYQCNRENIDNATVFGLYSDLSFNFLGNSLLSFGVNVLDDLKAHPYLGPDIDSSHAHELGTMFTYGLGLDINNFLDTQNIVFVHAAASNPNPNGNIDDYKIINPVTELTAGNYPGFTVEDYASGTMISKMGYSFYLGGKYNLNKEFALGAEYNYGSKYWFAATQGAEDIFNKLALRGQAAEVYGSWSFHQNLNAKLGYLYMKENYTGSGWHFGEPATKDATQNIYYLSLEARF